MLTEYEKYKKDLKIIGEDEYRTFMYRGIECVIARNSVGCVNGYMHLPYGDTKSDKDIYDMLDDVAHGGITFLDFIDILGYADLQNAGQYAGFDTAHAFDFIPKTYEMYKYDDISSRGPYRDVRYVRKVLTNMVDAYIEEFKDDHLRRMSSQVIKIAAEMKGKQVGTGQSPDLIFAIADELGYNIRKVNAIDLLKNKTENDHFVFKIFDDKETRNCPDGCVFVADVDYHPYGHCGVITNRGFNKYFDTLIRTIEQNINGAPVGRYNRAMSEAHKKVLEKHNEKGILYDKIIGYFMFC